MSESFSRWRWSGAALLLASVALFVFLAYALAPFTPDDSYISFRYASHLAAGAGLTFNTGAPPVEGYSNLLWILVCAVFAWAHLDLVTWSRGAGLVFGVGTLWIAWRMLEGRGRPRAQMAVVLLALATAGPFVLYAISGLETALFGFLLMLALLAAERVAQGRAGWLVALAASGVALALCRPEGVLVFPVIVGFMLATGLLPRRRTAAAATLAFVLAVAAYHAWRVHYFGEWLPTPFHSKGAAGALLQAWKTNLRYLLVRQNHYFAPLGWYDLGFAAAALLGQAALLRRTGRPSATALPLAVAAILGALYMNFVDWMPGMRYFAPLLPLVIVSLEPLAPAPRAPAATSARARGWGAGVALVVVLAAGLGSIGVLRRDARLNEASTAGSQVALGRWLAANVPGDALLAVSDVGAIPYCSGLPTMDINPRSLTDVQIAEHGWSDAYFFELDPDVVVLVSFSLTRPAFYPEHQALYETAAFRARYRLVGVTRYDRIMDRCYWVFAGPRVRLSAAQIASLPKGVGGG